MLIGMSDFPTCQGSFIPDMDFSAGFNLAQEVGPNYLYGLLDNEARVAIHYSHRITAIFLTIIFLILISKLWFSSAAPLASTLGIVLLTQISLGIMNVVYVLPLYIAIAHNLVAALLLLTTLYINMLAWKNEILRSYYHLCKPNVVFMMLITSLIGSLLATTDLTSIHY